MRTALFAVLCVAVPASSAELHGPLGPVQIPAALDGFNLDSGDDQIGSVSIKGTQVRASAAYVGSGEGPLEAVANGFRAKPTMGNGKPFKVECKDLSMTADQRFVSYTYNGYRIFGVCKDKVCRGADVPFVGVAAANKDRSRYDKSLAVIRATTELKAELFEQPSPKNPREASEIWFDETNGAEAMAKQLARTLRGALGFVAPKKWTYGFAPTAVQVFVGGKDAGTGPRISPVHAQVTPPTAEAIKSFLSTRPVMFSHLMSPFICKADASLAATCKSTTSAGFTIATKYEVDGTTLGFTLDHASFKKQPSFKVNVKTIGPDLMFAGAGDLQVITTCNAQGVCEERGRTPSVGALRFAPGHPLIGIIEDSIETAAVLVNAGPPPADATEPVIRHQRYRGDDAADFARLIEPYVGKIRLEEGEMKWPYIWELSLPAAK